jgi:nucleotide-binding universal stress UspA family protein
MALPLVVGVDGSDASLVAVDWAADEAARNRLPLRLVYASCWWRYEGPAPTRGTQLPPGRTTAEYIVGSAAERARRRNLGVRVTTGVIPEDTVSALLREGNNASVLVTGWRGRGGLTGEPDGLLLGSTGLAVAARAHGPVVVVRGDSAGLAGTHARILLGAGESDTGGEALRFALREAETRGCVLDAVRAWRAPAPGTPAGAAPPDRPVAGYEDQAAALLEELLREERVAHPEVQVCGVTVEGPAHWVLVERSAAADLVVVGARRRVGHFGLQLGRTDHVLLHHARCPVAIVPARV